MEDSILDILDLKGWNTEKCLILSTAEETIYSWEMHILFNHFILTLKAPRKKMHLKMLSAEVVCCK